MATIPHAVPIVVAVNKLLIEKTSAKRYAKKENAKKAFTKAFLSVAIGPNSVF